MSADAAPEDRAPEKAPAATKRARREAAPRAKKAAKPKSEKPTKPEPTVETAAAPVDDRPATAEKQAEPLQAAAGGVESASAPEVETMPDVPSGVLPPEAGWSEPETSLGSAAQAEGGKRKRRRRKGKGGGQQAPQAAAADDQGEPTRAESQGPREERERPEPRQEVKADAQPPRDRDRERDRPANGGGQAPQRPPQAPAPSRPAVNAEEVAKRAWKIYLAEVSEEGVALIGDLDARELSKRCFRLAEIFLEEQARRR